MRRPNGRSCYNNEGFQSVQNDHGYIVNRSNRVGGRHAMDEVTKGRTKNKYAAKYDS